MLAAHLILGITLVGFAYWLHQTEIRGWPGESFDSDLDAAYFQSRRRARFRVNLIIGICGILILIAGVSGPLVFVFAWLSVAVALLTVVILAALDVIRTQRYHPKKLSEIRRRTLDGDE